MQSWIRHSPSQTKAHLPETNLKAYCKNTLNYQQWTVQTVKKWSKTLFTMTSIINEKTSDFQNYFIKSMLIEKSKKQYE